MRVVNQLVSDAPYKVTPFTTPLYKVTPFKDLLHTLCLHLAIVPCGCFAVNGHTILFAEHHKALCARFNTFAHTLDELIFKSGCTPIHTKNLQSMIVEIFKSLNHFNPETMWDVSSLRKSSCKLRHGSALLIPRAKSSKW